MGVQAVGQGVDPGAEARAVEGRAHLRVVGARAGEADVLGHRRGEDVRVVVDQPDHAAYVVQREVAQVGAVEAYVAGDGVEEAHQRRGERRLARAGRRR